MTVSGISSATAVAGGYDHSCALLASGAVQCWGYNASGRLGNGTYSNSFIPVTVSGISNATAIAPGYDHTCALLANGAVQCWGDNSSGQLGNGATASSATPVTVSGISTATAIAPGSNANHSCARLASGTVQCWGPNGSGQLGNGTTVKSGTPVTVSGINTATAVAAGGAHSCALLASGAVQCWGSNGAGQLGNLTGLNNIFSSPQTAIGSPGLLWSSSDSAVARITAGGLATGLSAGSTLITATYGGISASTTLTIPNVPAYSLSLISLGNGFGTVSGAGIYLSGETATVSASASAGSTFMGWTGSANDAECTTGSVLMDTNKSCTATFTLNTYTLTLSTAGAGSGTVSGGGTYNYGSTASVTATASDGSTFAGWSGDCWNGAVVMTADKYCTATFNLVLPDLSLSLSASSVTALTGDTVSYTLSVTNASTASATGVTVSGTLPTCAIGTIPAGATVTCPTASVITAAAGTLTQTMTVSADQADPNTTNNTRTVSTTVITPADLVLGLTATPGSVMQGDTLRYTMIATNNGPAAATGVTVSGSLPSCFMGDIAVGATAQCTASVKTSAAGTLTVAMNVSGNEPDQDSANNSASVGTQVAAVSGYTPTVLFAPWSGDTSSSYASDVSADGSFVIGTRSYPGHYATYFTHSEGYVTYYVPGDTSAFRKDGVTINTINSVGTVTSPYPRSYNYASTQTSGISADGSVVVGFGYYGNDQILPSYSSPYRWTSATNTVVLSDGYTSTEHQATGVSANGNVIVGKVSGNAYRWSEATGTQLLGSLPGAVSIWDNNVGYSYSQAYGISGDGKVVVGKCANAGSNWEACRWTETGAIVGLGDLDGGTFSGSANDASQDGSVIVGRGTSAAGQEAFRWTQAAGMVGLGDLPGGTFSSEAHDVSADGKIIIGQSTSDVGPEAFIWTAETGMRSLKSALITDYGIELTGWKLIKATAISADGSTVVGYGTNPTGQTVGWEVTGLTRRSSDLALTMTAAPGAFVVGANLVYTLTVQNNGLTDAENVVLTDALPATLDFVSVLATQGTCNGTSALTCAIGNLASGASATVTLTIKPNAKGTITNSAAVATNGYDPNLTNNSVSISVSNVTYTLSLSTAGNGSGTVNGAGTYDYGTSATVTATANTGSTFAGWSGPDGAECTNSSVLMNADKSCTATFTLIATADLRPTALTTTQSGTTVMVNDTAKNKGSKNITSAFTVAYYLSTNKSYQAGKDIALANDSSGGGTCTRSITSLKAGASNTGSKTCYKPTAAKTGVNYYVLVVDDVGNVIAESNETNNVRSTSNTVFW